ncbi:MAG: hypothetical protein IJF94_02365 [Eubacterium sp.]|nr:hypothetical protein [Eubacterium sp.]
MKNGLLVIYDSEAIYAKHLMDYISDKPGMPFKTTAFTEKNSLFSFLKENNVDILLISAKEMCEEILEFDIQKIVLLTDGNVISDYVNYSSIYKYQSSENVIREVLDYFVDIHKQSGVVPVYSKQADIIGIYSPVGRCGKTLFSIALGQVLSEDYNTLYLNLDEFSPLAKYCNENNSGDLADLMYFFKQDPSAISIKLHAIVNNINGLDFIPPLTYFQDLREVKTQEWANMLTTIASLDSYEKIVIDIGGIVSNIFEMMEVCESVYLPLLSDNYSLMRVEQLEEYMLSHDMGHILDKLKKVEVPRLSTDNVYEEIDTVGMSEIGDCARTVYANAS